MIRKIAYTFFSFLICCNVSLALGHESIETTHKYMVADIEIKRKAMERLDETSNSSFNYKPSKSILAFLASL